MMTSEIIGVPEERLIEKELKDLTNIVEAGEQYCYLLTQDILHDTLKMIEDRYYEGKSIPFAVNSVMNQMNNLLNYVFVQRDSGEEREDPCWKVDGEPQLIPIDSWARSTIPVTIRKKVKPPSLQSSRSTISLKSMGSMRRSKVSLLDPAMAEKLRSARSNISSASSVNTQITSNRSNSRNNAAPTTRPKKKAKKKEAVADQAAEQQAQNQAQIEAEKKKKQEEKFMFQMRGKEFTYDSNGEVIVIKRIDPSRLPSTNVKPKFAVVDASQPGDEKEEVVNVVKKAPNQVSHRRNAPEPKQEVSYVTNLTPANPMIEKLKPARGVTMRDGKKVFRGPNMEFDKTLIKSKRKNVLEKSDSAFQSSSNKGDYGDEEEYF